MGKINARCPVCGWESALFQIDDSQPNGKWMARSEAASAYWNHYDSNHLRPAATFREWES